MAPFSASLAWLLRASWWSEEGRATKHESGGRLFASIATLRWATTAPFASRTTASPLSTRKCWPRAMSWRVRLSPTDGPIISALPATRTGRTSTSPQPQPWRNTWRRTRDTVLSEKRPRPRSSRPPRIASAVTCWSPIPTASLHRSRRTTPTTGTTLRGRSAP